MIYFRTFIVLLQVCTTLYASYFKPKGPSVDLFAENEYSERNLRQIDEGSEVAVDDKKMALSSNNQQTTKIIDKDLCRNVKNFIKKEYEISENLIPNSGNICSNIAKTCCTAKDFKNLENWWEAPTDQIKMSRKDIRQSKQEDLLLYTSKLLSAYDLIKEYAIQMAQPVNKPDGFCSEVAKQFKNYKPDYSIFKKEYFQKNAKKCWSFINKLQTSILCASCDPEAQSIFSINKTESNKIYITQEGLNDFNMNCREIFLFNVKVLRPYLKLVEKLTRCTYQGSKIQSIAEITGELVGLVDENSQSSGEYINDIALPWLGSLGSTLNANLEGDYQLLIGVFKRFSQKFPEEKDLTAKEIEERLNTLGDEMMKLGFNDVDINNKILTEKFRLKELLKMGESVENYIYKQNRLGNQLPSTASTDTVDKPKQTRRLEETAQEKIDASYLNSNLLTQNTPDHKPSHATNLTYDDKGVGSPSRHLASTTTPETTNKNQYMPMNSSPSNPKYQFRRLKKLHALRHQKTQEARRLQINLINAPTANDLELMLETRLAWFVDWIEEQYLDKEITRHEFHPKYTKRLSTRNGFGVQVSHILRCMNDKKLNVNKKKVKGNGRTRNWYHRGSCGWSGICRCPDGQRVWVGDRCNGCRSIACYGGRTEFCKRGNHRGSGWAMHCAVPGPRVPCFWSRKYYNFVERRCLDIDWSDPDPVKTMEDVTLDDYNNVNRHSINRRKINFSIINYIIKEVKYDKINFADSTIKPLEQLRAWINSNQIEEKIFRNPKYNTKLRMNYYSLKNSVNYMRSNIKNSKSRILKKNAESKNSKRERILESADSVPLFKKNKTNGLKTGDNEFDQNLAGIGKMQREITRRLNKLMKVRKARRRQALNLRFEVKTELNYELTKDMTTGGFDTIRLDLNGINWRNPYKEIAKSAAVAERLVGMDAKSTEFYMLGRIADLSLLVFGILMGIGLAF